MASAVRQKPSGGLAFECRQDMPESKSSEAWHGEAFVLGGDFLHLGTIEEAPFKGRGGLLTPQKMGGGGFEAFPQLGFWTHPPCRAQFLDIWQWRRGRGFNCAFAGGHGMRCYAAGVFLR